MGFQLSKHCLCPLLPAGTAERCKRQMAFSGAEGGAGGFAPLRDCSVCNLLGFIVEKPYSSVAGSVGSVRWGWWGDPLSPTAIYPLALPGLIPGHVCPHNMGTVCGWGGLARA